MPIALLLCATLIAIGRIALHDFVQFDDPQTIALNSWFNPPSLAGAFKGWSTPAGHLYIPLTYTLWGCLATIAHVDQPDAIGSSLNPFVFHTASITVHLLSVVLVYRILELLRPNENDRSNPIDWTATVGATIFALHPIQVEAIAWASGFKDLLCTCFMLGAILNLILARRSASGPRVWLGALMTLCACLSKPTGIVTPFVAATLDILVLRTAWKFVVRDLSPWLFIAIIFAVIGAIAQPPINAYVTPLAWRPLIATDALAFYLSKLAFIRHYAIDYGRTPQRAISSGTAVWSWILPFAIASIAWLSRTSIRLLGIGLLISLLCLAPVLGFVPFTFQAFSTTADHYAYPAMLGFAIAATGVVARLRGGTQRMICILLLAALAPFSFVQAGYWKDGIALFRHTLEINPQSALAHTNLAAEYRVRGETFEAEREWRQAVAADPDDAFAQLSLADLAVARGDVASARQSYLEALRVYASQRNFDPALAARVYEAIAKKLDALSDPAGAEAAREAGRRSAAPPPSSNPDQSRRTR